LKSGKKILGTKPEGKGTNIGMKIRETPEDRRTKKEKTGTPTGLCAAGWCRSAASTTGNKKRPGLGEGTQGGYKTSWEDRSCSPPLWGNPLQTGKGLGKGGIKAPGQTLGGDLGVQLPTKHALRKKKRGHRMQEKKEKKDRGTGQKIGLFWGPIVNLP